MRPRTIVLLAGMAVVTAGTVAANSYLSPIAPTATGYAAKITCSGYFVSGRAVVEAQADVPDNPLRPFLRINVHNRDQNVTTSLLGLWGSTAWYTPGRGCTLSDQRPAFGEGRPIGRPATLRDRPLSGPSAERVTAALDAAFAEDDPAGRLRRTRAVVAVKGGQVVAERYARGFDADTRLLGWSMGKSITNAVVGRLVHQRRLSVIDTDLLDRWSDDGRARITVQDLLRMVSGLSFEEAYEPDTDATQMLFRPGDAGAYAASQPLVDEPGTRWSYSSGTTNILCDIAAQAATTTSLDLVRDLVFAPLGMASAVMEPDAAGDPVCSSFVFATARDWAVFGQWFLQDGVWRGERLLPDGWVEYSTTPVDVATEQPYGAHWWLNTGTDGQQRMPTVPADAYWASGNEGQQLVVIPSEDLVVVRLGLSQEFEGIEWGLEPLVADLVAALR